ncbi:hypothetical protein PLESTM_000752400 [Pleodorina starrii]|nr:hypothetical protein PLESTM_000752400 [Pleodorina starrii]
MPLSTKFRLLLPGWPGRLCAECQAPGTGARPVRAPAPRAALDTPPPPPPPPSRPSQPQLLPEGSGRRPGSRSGAPPQRPPARRGVVQPQHPPPYPAGGAPADPRGDDRTAAAAAAGGRNGPRTRPEKGGGSRNNSGGSSSGSGSGGAAARAGASAGYGGDTGAAARLGEELRSGPPGGAAAAASAGATRGHVGEQGASGRGAGGSAVWSQVRGADVETWASLVRQYGMTLGGAFAANALFRAAHFVDTSGALLAADSDRTRGLGNPPPPPPPQAAASGSAVAAAAAAGTDASPAGQPAAAAPPRPLDGTAFSELVQQLLLPATEAAVAGQLDATRCCRLLWALGKLSGTAGPAAEEAGEAGAGTERAETLDAGGGATQPGLPQAQQHHQHHHQQISGPAATEGLGQGKLGERPVRRASPGPALLQSAMRGAGAHCAAALAAQLLRHLLAAEEGGGGGDGAGGRGRAGSPAPRAGNSPGAGRADSDISPGGLNGRMLVMAAWGLARLTSEGHLRYGASYGGAEGAAAVTSFAPGRAELWDGLCAALRPRLVGLPARELSNAMWALAAARHCHHPVFGDLAAALEPHLEAAVAECEARRRPLPASGGGSCNVQDLANAVWALARSGRLSPDGAGSGSGSGSSRLLGLAESAVLCALPQLRAQHVASLLWSFVTMRYRPRRRVAAAAAAATSSPGAGAGAGGSRQQQQLSMYQLLARRVVELQLLQREDEGIVAQVVWALVKERQADERLLAAAAARLREGAGRLTLREAAMVASAYRMARCVDPGLFSALLLRAGCLPRWELLEAPHADVSISLLLRGLAWAGCYDKVVYTRLCDALHAHLRSIQPQPLALALWALAEAQHRQPAFLAAATTMATALVSRFSGGELSCTALSLARLGARNADFFGAAAVTLTALRGGGGDGGGGRGEGSGGGSGGVAEAAELVPGEAAPVYGEDESDEDDEYDGLDEEDEQEDEQAEDEEAEEEEGGGSELAAASRREAFPLSTAAAAPAGAGRRLRRRGGRRYWLPRAATALSSSRWRRIDLLNPQELANLMAAYAISGNVDEMLYYRAQIRTRRLLKASSVLRRDAAAAAGGGSAAAAAAALARGDPVAAADMSAAAVTKLLWAFVAVGVQEPPLLRALAARLRQLLQRLEPRDIAALAWALATSRLPDCDDLLARAVRAAAEHARAFAPADLATVAWAAATVGLHNPALMDACARLVLAAPPLPPAAAAAAAAAASGFPSPSLKVLSDVTWAHSMLRLYHPQLLARAGDLAAARLGGGAAASAAAAPAAAEATAPWLPPDMELNHLVALLEAHAIWAAAPAAYGSGAGERGGSCYHDGLFRAAARVLLSRLDELTSDEVVTLTWCCTAVLHELPPPEEAAAKEAAARTQQQLLQGNDRDDRQQQHHHPVLALLAALSELLAATPPDSFLQPELTQLAQAHAMSVDYAAAVAAAAAAEPPSLAPACAAAAPLALPAALLRRVSGAWGAAPAPRTRRLVVELCAALDEAGFSDVEMDARSEDGLLPVDVAATWRPQLRQAPTRGSHGGAVPPIAAGATASAAIGGSGCDGGALGPVPVRYAFLVATSELQAVGQPQVYWGPLAVRVRLLQARGWRVVVVPAPLAAATGGGGGGGAPSRGGGLDAAARREYVRELLRVVLAGADGVGAGQVATA